VQKDLNCYDLALSMVGSAFWRVCQFLGSWRLP